VTPQGQTQIQKGQGQNLKLPFKILSTKPKRDLRNPKEICATIEQVALTTQHSQKNRA